MCTHIQNSDHENFLKYIDLKLVPLKINTFTANQLIRTFFGLSTMEMAIHYTSKHCEIQMHHQHSSSGSEKQCPESLLLSPCKVCLHVSSSGRVFPGAGILSPGHDKVSAAINLAALLEN